MISFRVLGALDLRWADGEPIPSGLLRQKGVALLVFLACRADAGLVRRDTLAGLLWPDLDHQHARAALRKALYFLRKALGEGVLIRRGDEEVGISPDHLTYDAQAFEAALGAGQLEEALALYRGDFLSGFFVSGCQEFEAWTELERTRLRERAAGAAWGLAANHLQAGQLTLGERMGQKAMDLVCTDEDQIRRFIQALAEAGDRAAAIRFFERFEALLQQELEVSPSRETTALVGRILAEEEGVVGPFGAPPDTLLVQPPTADRRDGLPGRRGPAHALPGLLTAPGRRALIPLILAGVVGGIAFGVTRSAPPSYDLTEVRIAVPPLLNRTGEESLGDFGILAAARVMDALDWAEFGRPVPLSEILFSVGAGAERGDPRTWLHENWQQETNADLAVLGAIFLLEDSVFLNSKIHQRDGGVIGKIPLMSGSKENLQELAEEYRFAVLSGLRDLLAPDGFQLMWPEGAPPANMESQRLLYEGAQLFGEKGSGDAIPLFERAVEIDSAFLAPRRWLVGAYITDGNLAKADSTCWPLEERLDEVSRQARLVTQMNCGLARGDHWEALRAARDLLEYSSLYHLRVGQHALDLNRPHEAAESLAQYDPTSSRLTAAFSDMNSMFHAVALHWIGKHQEELRVSKEARRVFPESQALILREVVASVALGKPEEAEQVLHEGLALLPANVSPGPLLNPAAREFDEQGFTEQASRLWARLASWHEVRSGLGPSNPSDLTEWAEALLLLGRPGDASPLLQVALDQDPDNLGALGRMGVAFSQLGKAREAERVFAILQGREDPYDRGENASWRAFMEASSSRPLEAIALLKHAIAEGMGFTDLAPRESPYLKPLRGHPAFEEFLAPKG